LYCHACDWLYQDIGIIRYCGRCGHVFRLFDGDPIQYHALEYRSDRRFQRTEHEFDENGAPTEHFHSARQKIVEDRWNAIQQYISQDDSCLDIGAGGGTFAKQLDEHVKNIDCTEVNPRLAAECKRLGFNTSKGDFLEMTFSKKYDIVFAWHVLEHIPDAAQFIEKASRLARKLFILEIPINRAIPEKFDGHYHHFTNVSLRLMLREPNIISVMHGVQAPALLAIVRPSGRNKQL